MQQAAPEFASAADEDRFVVYTAFDGSRILNIGDTGAALEDRGIIIDYNEQRTFAKTAPIVESTLKGRGLLDPAYEIGDLMVLSYWSGA